MADIRFKMCHRIINSGRLYYTNRLMTNAGNCDRIYGINNSLSQGLKKGVYRMNALINLERKHIDSYRFTTNGSQPTWFISMRPLRSRLMHSADIYCWGGLE